MPQGKIKHHVNGCRPVDKLHIFAISTRLAEQKDSVPLAIYWNKWLKCMPIECSFYFPIIKMK